MNWRRRFISISCTALVCSSPWPIFAADSAPGAARTLFDEGVALVQKQQFDEACPKFEQSLALERQAATWFALADCNAQRGRIVAAIEAYSAYLAAYEALPIEKKQKHEERVKVARSQMEVLRPLIATLTISVPAAERTGFVLMVDGQKAETKNAQIKLSQVDPGDHRLVVQVPGAEQKELRITLGQGEHREVELYITIRLKANAEPPKPNSSVVQALQPAVVPMVAAGRSALRIAGFGSFGIGAAGLVVGVAEAGLAFSKMDEIKQNCAFIGETSVVRCKTPADANTANNARRNADIGTAGFGVAIAGAITGAILLIRDKSTKGDPTKTSRPSLMPRFGADKSGVRGFLEGVW